MATEQLLSLIDYIAYRAKCRFVSQLHNMTSLEKRHALYGLDRVKEDMTKERMRNYANLKEEREQLCRQLDELEAPFTIRRFSG